MLFDIEINVWQTPMSTVSIYYMQCTYTYIQTKHYYTTIAGIYTHAVLYALHPILVYYHHMYSCIVTKTEIVGGIYSFFPHN